MQHAILPKLAILPKHEMLTKNAALALSVTRMQMARSEPLGSSEQGGRLKQLAVANVLQGAQVMPQAVQHCCQGATRTYRALP